MPCPGPVYQQVFASQTARHVGCSNLAAFFSQKFVLSWSEPPRGEIIVNGQLVWGNKGQSPLPQGGPSMWYNSCSRTPWGIKLKLLYSQDHTLAKLPPTPNLIPSCFIPATSPMSTHPATSPMSTHPATSPMSTHQWITCTEIFKFCS